MTVLVTGASGRMGSLVVQGLRDAGMAVRSTDIRPSPTTERIGDIGDPAFAAELVSAADAVIHLAGHPNSREWPILDRLNIGATWTLIEASAKVGVRRFVHASSVHAVGLAAADAHLSGAMPAAPDSPYGVSKVMGEALLQYACFHYGMSGIALRICAFRPEPGNARELRLWLSPGDMLALMLASITADFTGMRVVWGISANRRADVARHEWDAIGYRPRDEAEDHLERLISTGVDTRIVSEWPLLGGAFAVTQ